MREPLLMKVEIGGAVEHRQAEPVQLYNEAGLPIATYMRPIVRPGEGLVQRLGTFPTIISGLA